MKSANCQSIKNMYIDFTAESLCFNVVQKYSAEENLVAIIKPTGINRIINFAPPRFVKTCKGMVTDDLSSAYERSGAENMTESDWLGPHYINWNWYGGTHGTTSGTGEPTGFSENLAIKINGEAVNPKKNISCFADSLEITWDTYAGSALKENALLKERHFLLFDGIKWNVRTDLEFFTQVKWMTYHGMQCVYGIWNGTVTYDGKITKPISCNATDGTYMTESGIKACETILLNKGTDYLEMYLDPACGLGDRRYLQVDSGAFTATYCDAKNGKAYFSLVRGGNGTQMKKGDTAFLFGHYRFYSSSGNKIITSDID